MKIFVKAKPNSAEAFVKQIDEQNFEVAVKEPPVQGRANRAIVKALADYLNIAPLRIRIISGYTSRQKVIELL